ncbi:ESPR domain-containing protein [Haemophilus sp.]|uniref:ESPR domain-containing protein n=1 Tax=Haemophilus sp. TaxID=740 RepID=UPI0035220E5F
MNKVFKIIWNKTTQSFVVTSELAKGAVKASSNSEQRVTSETRLSSLFKLSAFALSLSASDDASTSTSSCWSGSSYKCRSFEYCYWGAATSATVKVLRYW